MKKIIILPFIYSSFLLSHGLEWWMVPFAITSSPSIYTSASLEKKKPHGYSSETFEFVRDNREELQIEVAQGEGELLDTLATFYDKMDKKYVPNREEWKAKLQKNYEKIFFIKGEPFSDEDVDYMLFDMIFHG